ncbi:DUF1259 domain-containing protein [Kitasatospora sp. NPDC004799]|uniref:DUF1259 domain-containing protein n=1 Tax=Kitasatospora sp. NPDC004799 TaxID=3154460 RepID=UPI0033BAFB2E
MRRRSLLRTLAMAAPAAALTGGAASAAAADEGHGHGEPLAPVTTTEADWQPVAELLGRTGTLSGGTVYRAAFPRRDLSLTSYGVRIEPGLSLGSYAAFARYPDGRAMVMGDLVVLETELQQVTDALHANDLDQSAIHKHLLAHDPAVWWTHFHAVGDAEEIAEGFRATLDATATPPPAPTSPAPAVDLDTAGIDAAFDTAGRNDGGIYKFSFARDERITLHARVAPPAMGVTTAIGFQPVGGGRAAINGDFAMTAHEVQDVITALRAGGIQVVELHNHGLDDDPRLFYLHFWAVADGVELARTLAAAVAATRVHPA